MISKLLKSYVLDDKEKRDIETIREDLRDYLYENDSIDMNETDSCERKYELE